MPYSLQSGNISRLVFEACSNESLCDVTLVSDNGNVYAHKVILLREFSELRYLLCSLSHGNHERVTIVLDQVPHNIVISKQWKICISSQTT